MANHLKMAENESILALHRQGWSKRRIARELEVDRQTVRRVLKANLQADGAYSSKSPTPVISHTGLAADLEAKSPAPGIMHTGSVCTEVPHVGRPSQCEPHRQLIEQKIESGLSVQRIFQDLQEGHGFEGTYHSVLRMVQRLRTEQPLPFRRMVCDPGAEAQADFGRGAPIISPDGSRRYSHVLRVSLSYSRKGYSEAFYKQDTESWLTGWENAFWAWGGVPKILQIDNTKAAVHKADWYDPEIHPIIRSFCQHYGTVLLPIKARTPRHNGKIERNISYVKNNGLKGHHFESLSAENTHLERWESHVADLRIHGTTKQQVRKLFEIEKAALLPLPVERFSFFHEGKRTVHRDGHVEVAKAYYSVPPEYTGHTVWARWDSHLVRIYNLQFAEIRMHVRGEPGCFKTAPADISSKKIALVESGATALLHRARLVGPQTGRWAEAMLKERDIAGVRVLVGLLSLVKRHSPQAVESACELAMQHNAFHLRELRALIKDPVEQEQFEFMAEHPLIRDLDDYGTLVKVHFGTGNPWEEPVMLPPEQNDNGNNKQLEGRIENGSDPALN